MSNIAQWIETLAAGESVEAACIGTHYQDGWCDDQEPFNSAPIGVVLSWEQARPFLEYEFYSGFGGADCHPVVAWTTSKIIQISEYDGSTRAVSAPRHPIDCVPTFN
jgi:hypothetical protein